MHVHVIGICGTGMASLAGLLRSAGHRVTGSDTAFYPPMGEALTRWGIEAFEGYDAAHLKPQPDLVVVGNVCRSNNPEARAAIDGGIRYLSFPAALEELFLKDRRSFVVAGTHGKTTTSACLAYLLDATGQNPGFLIGGLPNDFPESFRSAALNAPFVVEGDEYDSAFFEKTPKFWRYRPYIAAINAIEYDHVDIYPDLASYYRAFCEFVARIPEQGLLVAFAGDPLVREVARGAHCRTCFFALKQDSCDEVQPRWQAVPGQSRDELQSFELWIDGVSHGVCWSRLAGNHNVRNILAAMAMAAEGAQVPVQALAQALPGFSGVRRRQQMCGVAGGVRVYDDFAHHPTAVIETLKALRQRHPQGKLIAIFEPRSATASRRVHQQQYPAAFQPADVTLLAPVGRPEIPDEQKLDIATIAAQIRVTGRQAETPGSIERIVERVAELAREGDTVVAMSNGAFGNIHQRLLQALSGQKSPTIAS
jgi:UDP-N-acetylmuramate: L-alanyl-gamma-D-glutamyl-meso-diaminopimelate ligase